MGKRYANSYKIDIVAQFDDIINPECFFQNSTTGSKVTATLPDWVLELHLKVSAIN